MVRVVFGVGCSRRDQDLLSWGRDDECGLQRREDAWSQANRLRSFLCRASPFVSQNHHSDIDN